MLDPLIHLGTSTFAYAGWQGPGLVYQKPYAKSRFARECLEEYCQFQYRGEPLFRTVGIDSTFYGPPSEKQLTNYAAQMPDGFRALCKVWERITIPRFANLPEYGVKAGQDNPDFLSVDLFLHHVLPPYRRVFAEHTGPLIFEFQRTGIEPETFLTKLDTFLGHLPKEFEYAVEVRNTRVLGKDYNTLLAKHGVSHVFSHWSFLPELASQFAQLGEQFTAPFVVFRLLTPRNVKYEQAVRIAEPYNKIVAELPEMRRDTIAIVGHAVQERRRAYVLINNRSEGCAPLTAQALYDRFVPQG